MRYIIAAGIALILLYLGHYALKRDECLSRGGIPITQLFGAVDCAQRLEGNVK